MAKMGTLSTKEEWTKVLLIIPDETVRKDLDQKWGQSSLTPDQKWEMLLGAVRSSKKPGMSTVAQDIIFQYSYPRLDSHVSIGLNHLLKSPFCVHPKTGRVCIPIDPLKCKEFNPLNVPKLEDLVHQLAAGKGILCLNDRDITSASP